MCDKNCSTTSCPFAFTDESETIQNYGCLPTPFEIVTMRVLKGKTWACHSNPSKPCVGGLKAVREFGYDNKIIDIKLVTEENITKNLVEYTDSEARIIQDNRMKKYIADNNL